MNGTVLILNGTSSAGKSTLVRAIQATLEEPFLEAGLDKFLWMLPSPYLNDPALWARVMTPTRAGPIGMQLVSGMHHSIAALARAGNHVVADHVLVDERWLRECAELLAELPAHFIGVRCALEVVEERERARKDRTLGQARAQIERIHSHAGYDFEVDTGRHSADACAAQIQDYLALGRQPRAFARIRNLTDHP